MSQRFLLGIDTGGTYTDAVIFDETTSIVVAKAKAPTSHDDLAIGITAAIDKVLALADVPPEAIELVSLSTTLATNALVEGKGRSVCSVIIGFEPAALDRAGLSEAMGPDPVILLAGGHDSHGYEITPLDLELLADEVDQIIDRVDAFAVTAQFSVRNASHELAAAALLRQRTHRPVTCSHQLSAKLNGPKRAVTAVLNARLISIVEELVDTTGQVLRARRIVAPLMVVRGDGSLVAAAFVRERPIETILSGPAASLVGAAHLTGLTDGVISDIGGTTTDIAVLRAGIPLISQEGATVGGYQTMVAAVAMDTHGLGGDSEVRHDERAAGPVLLIGPRRVVPLCRLGLGHPERVRAMLEEQLCAEVPSEADGVMVWPALQRHRAPSLDATEAALVAALVGPPTPAADLVTSSTRKRALARLVHRGLVHLASFTPTDASHVLGLQHDGDRAIAEMAADLFARRRDRLGRPIAADGRELASMTVDGLVRRSAEAVLAAAFVRDGMTAAAVSSPVVQAALDDRAGLVQVRVGLAAPLVALGASAATYYPRVGEMLRSQVIVPEHADVANAIGAVVGRVRLRVEMTINAPQHGQFLVQARGEPVMHVSLEEARRLAHELLAAEIAIAMAAAGALRFESDWMWDEKVIDVGGLMMFVEGIMTVVGSGRPELR